MVRKLLFQLLQPLHIRHLLTLYNSYMLLIILLRLSLMLLILLLLLPQLYKYNQQLDGPKIKSFNGFLVEFIQVTRLPLLLAGSMILYPSIVVTIHVSTWLLAYGMLCQYPAQLCFSDVYRDLNQLWSKTPAEILVKSTLFSSSRQSYSKKPPLMYKHVLCFLQCEPYKLEGMCKAETL